MQYFEKRKQWRFRDPIISQVAFLSSNFNSERLHQAACLRPFFCLNIFWHFANDLASYSKKRLFRGTTSNRTSEGKQTSFAITAFSQRKNPQSSKVCQHVVQLYKQNEIVCTDWVNDHQSSENRLLLYAQQEKTSMQDYFEHLHSLKLSTLCKVILKLLRIVGGNIRPGIISAINVNIPWHTPLSRSKTLSPNWGKAQCHWLPW